MNQELLDNIDAIHTTELGVVRIKRNLGFEKQEVESQDVVAWCRQCVKRADDIIQKGKNYYVYADNAIITINAHSFTIITAHRNETNLADNL